MSTVPVQAAPQGDQRPKKERFIEFVQDRIKSDAGTRARLRRSLRSDGEITSDALWVIGGWLPTDLDGALIWARVAAGCAAYSKQTYFAADGPEGRPFQASVAGQLARPEVKENSAQRILEHITREGMETAQRLNHVARALEICPHPERIDWARLIGDLEGLAEGGERALRARLRWYRAYHQVGSAEADSIQRGEAPERNDHND